jgi:hypothetical protein
LTKVSFHKDYVLVETDTINLADLKIMELRMYYLVEIHDTASEEVGCIMEDLEGVLQPRKFDTFSKAKVQAGLVKEKLTKTQYTHIVSVDNDKPTNSET